MFDAGFTNDLLDAALLPPAALLVAAFVRAWPGFILQSIERQEQLPWTADRIAAAAREAILRAAFLVLMPLWGPGAAPARVRAVDPVRPPVLLVPDPAWGRTSVYLLASFVRRRGRVAQAMQWSRPIATLAEHADELDRHVEALRQATGAVRVDVIGAGAGGTIAAWYTRHRRGPETIRRLITLGAPWTGTRTAIFRTGPLARELVPGSLHLEGLLPPVIPSFAIAAEDDPVVIPHTSALADPHRSLILSGCGHLGLLMSARSFRAVALALSDPLPIPMSEPAPEAAP
jgi:pimeloyl-ACP methyl ester carboxylesterase